MERQSSTLEREQELALAIEIEVRSIALWSALCAHPATLDVVARLTDERLPERLHAGDLDHVLADQAVALVTSSRDPALLEHAGAIAAAARELAAARNQLIEAHMWLVEFSAFRFGSTTVAREDLIQEGALGLMKAVDRYDHRRGLRFSTFATWWIRNRIGRALVEGGRLAKDVRLDAPVGEDGQAVIELFVDPSGEDADAGDALDSQRLTRATQELLATLTELEREVLHRRFGIDAEDERTQSLREIASDKGLSHERVRQIEAKALRKLRERLVPVVAEPRPESFAA